MREVFLAQGRCGHRGRGAMPYLDFVPHQPYQCLGNFLKGRSPTKRGVAAAIPLAGLAECAMLAGLPKAPSANNPVVNPRRARQRQAYILLRMLELGRIGRGKYDAALLEPLRLK
ncbi:putative bifunctional transglycosylase and transpeptidase [Cupriavidus basilensis OR16]|uniref:Putative bifunctional transglycosylase and transpeptidase n=1 Tax=Cupriavidus basilensis OR16 TaxID=1127483 RepID=H1RZD9_9BURK|nr:putative bifunctional transglycosylase and transpeptidase [Cupriavidus basilensis OR16]